MSCFFQPATQALGSNGRKKKRGAFFAAPITSKRYAGYVFSPSSAVLSAILRDEYMTSAVRTTVLFIFVSSINNKRSILRFQLTTSPLTEGGLPVALLFKMAGFGSPRFNEIAMQQPKYLDALFHFS